MKVYVDSSALIKRAVAEAESERLEQVLERHVEPQTRWCRRRLHGSKSAEPSELASMARGQDVFTEAIDNALAGVAERAITPDVVSLARRIGPNVLPVSTPFTWPPHFYSMWTRF